MNREDGMSSPWSIAVGAFLIVEGVWGLMSPVVFGALTTNTLHACIHIVLGIVGITAGMRGGARGFSTFLGVLLIAVGILRFVPGASDIVVSLLNVNYAVAYFNIAVGIISLVIVQLSKRPQVAAP